MPAHKLKPCRYGVEAAKKAAGGAARLAKFLGITRQIPYTWDRVPQEHVLKIEAKYGISRSVLRPDVYPEGK